MTEKTSEVRTIGSYKTCCKCGLTMAPQMMLVHFERENEEGTWVVTGFEHLNDCTPKMKRPSLSCRAHVSSSWSG